MPGSVNELDHSSFPWMQYLLDILVNRRYLLGLAAVLLAVTGAFGIRFATSDTGVGSILSEGDPYKVEVDEVREDFPSSTSVVFIFEAPDIFGLEALGAMNDLTNRFAEVKGAVSVGSIMTRRLDEKDSEKLGRDFFIPEYESLSSEGLPAVRELVLSNESLIESVVAPSGDMAIANIKYKVNEDIRPHRFAVAESALALRDSLREKYPGVEIYLLGNVLFEYAGYEAQSRDRLTLFPLVMVLSIALLWFCLRSISYALSLFIIAFSTVAATVGSFGWANIAFNQISALGPLVVIVIALADGIHIVSIYVQGLRDGLGKEDAMRESLRVNVRPVALATLTTGIGFLCLNYSSSPGIYGFGNIVAIGVVWAFILTIALLPALVLMLPASEDARPLGVDGFIRWVKHQVTHRGSLLLKAGTILVIATLAMLPMNQLDFNRFSFVDEDSDFHHALEALAEKIGNDQSLVYGIYSDDYYGITQPDFLGRVDNFSTWLEEQQETSFVASYTDYLKGRNKSEHDDNEAYDVLPDDQLQIIDYLVGYQLIQEISPNLEPIFNSDYSAIRMVVGTSNLTNGEILAFSERIDGWIDDNLSDNYRILHGDNNILYARIDNAIARELFAGFTLSFILITATMLIGLGSVRYGLLSIAPNLFPATIVFGFWGLFVGELSPYILMLFSISIGLVVDDSVHMLSKYISARRDGKDSAAAINYSLDRAGSAITITTLSLAMGTFILVLSNTYHFQNVALLLTPIILVAWLLDLLYLPPLLERFDAWWDRRNTNLPTPV